LGNKSSKKNEKLSKKHLLPYELEQYRVIGEPDMTQHWLEIFTPAIVSDLFTIMNSSSNNQQKAEYIKEELGYYGFMEVGLGTNVYAMHNPAYPGVVYKFALDDNGLADNFNDSILQDMIDECIGGKIRRSTPVLARHPSGIVSVQERWVVIRDQDRMDTFRASILKALEKLAQKFLIVDLAPSEYHLNYGVDRQGNWRFLDASDLYPLSNIKGGIKCKKPVGWDDDANKMIRCGGSLRYTPDFSRIKCSKCGTESFPLEIRPNDKEDKAKMSNAMMDGLSIETREQMYRDEIDAISRRYGRIPRPGPVIQVDEARNKPPQAKSKARFVPMDSSSAGVRTPNGSTMILVDDDDVSVQRQSPKSPSPEALKNTHTSFKRGNNCSVIYSFNDDDEQPEEEPADDPQEDAADSGAVIIDTTEPEPEKVDPQDTKKSSSNEDEPECLVSLEYDNDELSAIKLKITGDIESALYNGLAPICVSFGKGSSVYTAISTKVLIDILTPICKELRDEEIEILGGAEDSDDDETDGEEDDDDSGPFYESMRVIRQLHDALEDDDAGEVERLLPRLRDAFKNDDLMYEGERLYDTLSDHQYPFYTWIDRRYLKYMRNFDPDLNIIE